MHFARLCLLVFVTHVLLGGLLDAAAAQPPNPLSMESGICPEFQPDTVCTDVTPYCGDDCDNLPFCPTTCWTTSSGPAWSGAGVGAESNNLYCPTGTYANCHYSGPPWPTGTSSENIPMPCELNEDGTMANCKCKVFEGPSYVNIYAIMNLGVYYETIEACGTDGSGCLNMGNCPQGSTLGSGDCTGTIAPVCEYISGQDPNNAATSLIPGADLISTFGLGMDSDYNSGTTSCEDTLFAGCMTAPCQYEENTGSASGSRYAYCACPVSRGAISLPQCGQICDLGDSYVWE